MLKRVEDNGWQTWHLLIAGVRYGPPGSKRLVYFVDDMNMPFVDKYDTQSAIELMRQSIDYKGWFDKVLDTADCHLQENILQGYVQ